MLRLIEKSTELAIPLEEFRNHLRRDDTEEDDPVMLACLQAAIEWAEGWTGRPMIVQTWDLILDDFPSDEGPVYLGKAPIVDVVGVFYRNGSETEFSSSSYALNEADGSVYLPDAGGVWPTTDGARNAARIRFRAGYIDLQDSPPSSATIPAPISAAIKIYAATLYAQREQFVQGIASPAPWGAEQLLRLYRVDDSLA